MVIFLLVVTAALLWGATPILEKMGLTNVDPLVGITLRSTIAAVSLLILTVLLGRGSALIEASGKAFLLFGASGLLAGALGMWAFYAALKMEAVSKIVPISASYPLVTALLSTLILREGVTLPRVIGTAFIVIGIWFVK
jgi:bacterial/archaeal transporter family protein